jgi:hypothetical protein
VWRYRDWVVQSLNADRPYDQFVTQQVAGDELTPYRDENIIATGFLAVARLAGEELSCVRQENDLYVDMVNATSSALLGLTVACAQCHDHKFDPITQRDYYRLQAFFVQGYPGNLVLATSRLPDDFARQADAYRRHSLSIRQRILREAYQEESPDIRATMLTDEPQRSLEQESLYRLTRARLNIRLAGCNGFRVLPEERQRLDELKAKLDACQGQIEQTWGFYSPVTSPHPLTVLPMASNFPLIHDAERLAQRSAYLLRRGDPYDTALRVTPGWPAVLDSDADSPDADSRDADSPDADSPDAAPARTRTDLARWLTSPRNPLTARVWVNRLWHYHFGRGLVATPGNFGLRGAAPTHSELLDYLAAELIDSGWSTKHVQRLIVSSSTYRQSAAWRAEAASADADNQWLWRWPLRRLESEAIRDATLAASGQLDDHLGGPSVPVGQESPRRSIYLFQRRDQPTDAQLLFDGPTAMSASCDCRHVSTTALQSLYLLNDAQAIKLADALARRVAREAGADLEKQIDLAFRYTLSRSLGAVERNSVIAFLQEEQHELAAGPATQYEPPPGRSPLTRFCQTLLNLNEFIYVP